MKLTEKFNKLTEAKDSDPVKFYKANKREIDKAWNDYVKSSKLVDPSFDDSKKAKALFIDDYYYDGLED